MTKKIKPVEIVEYVKQEFNEDISILLPDIIQAQEEGHLEIRSLTPQPFDHVQYVSFEIITRFWKKEFTRRLIV